MKTINRIMLLILVSVLTINANFRVVKIEGGSFASLKQTLTSVKEENVRIILFRDSCQVVCKFTVQNDQKSEKLLVSFPNSLADYDMFRNKKGEGISNFRVSFDGNRINHQTVVDTTLSFGKFKDNEWFQFPVTINKSKIHRIECRYTDKHYGMYHYLIGTGATWNGPINKGNITFDHSNICSHLFIEKTESFKSADLEFPIKLIPKQYSDSLVYSFENYRPDSNEVVGIRFFQYWTGKTNYLDTISITYDNLSGLFFFGYKNEFIYRFLGDTVKYHHGSDLTRIRDELFRRIGTESQTKLNKLSFGEKTAIELLSTNLDSLKQRMKTAMERKYSYAIDSLVVIDSCKDTLSIDAIKNEIGRTALNSPINLPYISLIAEDFLIGKFDIIGQSNNGEVIDTIFFDGIGRKQAEKYYSMIAEMIGMDKGRMIFGKSRCSKVISLFGRLTEDNRK